MNNRAASSAVSKEAELTVACDLTLLGDVFLDHLLIAMRPHRRDEVAVRPELPAPQILLDLRAGAEDLSSRDALDDLHDLLRTVHRHTLHQKMHMVCVCPDFQELDLVSLFDFSANFFELGVHFRTEHGATIFRWTNNVIHQN